MADESDKSKLNQQFRRKVEESQKRKIRARRQGDQGVWFGLGMFGLVGWSVAIPVLAAIALGIWIDSRIQSRYSWTLMLLLTGIIVGCLNAWFWISRERKNIEEAYHRERRDEDDS
ncbi:AtpZ/AtpI family protein [Desulfuromonas sp. AOP6]|uniref:AtpZ/AtpI family protein n=1 Tax=Desulfuromonas sp. AOP6 TaxID=1566351 RepID=UPI0012803F80|nr:AtpZ/AtpI family protein [Desulfuromonas sp. AOP6]BCA79924.1 ATP synthase I [Desulfuromonas sp. AOP6]